MLTTVTKLDKENDKTKFGKCPICGNELLYRHDFDGVDHFECPSCGFFQMPIEYRCITEIDKSIFHGCNYLVAGYLYETKNRRDKYLQVGESLEAKITAETVATIRKNSRIPKTHLERLERLLLNLCKYYKWRFDITFSLVLYGKRNIYPAFGYAKDDSELRGMLIALCDKGWICNTDTSQENYAITIDGLEKAHSLSLSSSNVKNKENTNKFEKLMPLIYNILSLSLASVSLIIQIIK